ncbi:GspE/PulE family protein [uncultured Piscinibacter sp.]|uniref:GspE/PulE family protein n=1 Tax=uncultured Piscinibacter sp. TaxID=1131835 RepID=UPI00262855D6|nr:GspE/PulE family protein [uncultured Piscinibacter sp.]
MNPVVLTSSLPPLQPADFARGRDEAARSGRSLLEVLEEQAALDEDAFVRVLGQSLSYPVLGMQELRDLSPDFDELPLPEAAQRGCVPVRLAGGDLAIVIGDPFAVDTMAAIEERVREPWTWWLAHPKAIAAYLRRQEDLTRALDGVEALSEGGDEAHRAAGLAQLSLASINDDESPVVRLVHSTLYDALKSGASDIHFETDPEGLVIKYRLDGVLTPAARPRGAELADQVLSRIKVMSELDIAERRIPQDGRFQLSFQDRPVDFRVSVMPSIHGEDAVLRVLDKRSLADQVRGLRLDLLGLDADVMRSIRALSAMPYGMLLVTGPTGSGKTTTLYAAVTEINLGQDKIITIEDPVEYQLPGVLQIPVNEKKGLTFARGLRSILRHDPDKILVGEVRDAETAQIAVQAALTGHLVLTTVHANSVFDVIGRIGTMGVDSFSFAAATNGIVAQRLVRMVCEHCAQRKKPPRELLLASGLDPSAVRGFRFRQGLGCGHCRGSGYRGRRAVAELLVLDEEMRELIARRESVRAIRQLALGRGTRLMREAAVDLVRQGVTTLQEINRVTALV